MLLHIVVKQASILLLGFAVAIQDDGNEKFEENEGHNEHETYEKQKWAQFPSTTKSLIAVSFVIFVVWIVLAVIPGFLSESKGHKCDVPSVYCRHSKKGDKGASKCLEVYIVTHVPIPFHITKVDHSNNRICVHEQ